MSYVGVERGVRHPVSRSEEQVSIRLTKTHLRSLRSFGGQKGGGQLSHRPEGHTFLRPPKRGGCIRPLVTRVTSNRSHPLSSLRQRRVLERGGEPGALARETHFVLANFVGVERGVRHLSFRSEEHTSDRLTKTHLRSFELRWARRGRTHAGSSRRTHASSSAEIGPAFARSFGG